MDVVSGLDALEPRHGPLFAVVGVFDGLHRGHAYLLEHLVRQARVRDARPTVITFDHHPDEVLTGSAPPLLLHPDERLEHLAAAGVAVTVVVHFDEALRRTTYDAFIGSIQRRTRLVGLLMTPDAAFGFERRGTPQALAELGAGTGFDVVVIEPFSIDGRSVRSSDIRAAIAAGDLDAASHLLGRPVSLQGHVRDGRLVFDWPMALPPDGTYPCLVGGLPGALQVRPDGALIAGVTADGPARVVLAAVGS